MADALLDVNNLKTHFLTRAGTIKAVDGISFQVKAGEALGLVGESGSGKSVTCLSIVRLVPSPAGRIVGGQIIFQGRDLLLEREREMKQWRGRDLAMILQDPLTSLNPVYTIGSQVAEVFRLEDRRLSGVAVRRKVVDVLERVSIPSARRRLKEYPFQFSGGMCQRVSAAMSIARSPKLLIADEPTTALDGTIQYQFLCLLKEMQEENKMGLILVTHDLGVVAETCDTIAVMYAGKIIEQGAVAEVYRRPAHPYTRALLLSIPTLGQERDRLYQTRGEPPNLLALPPGCSFWPRCDQAMEICRREEPPETAVKGGGRASCWLLRKGEEK